MEGMVTVLHMKTFLLTGVAMLVIMVAAIVLTVLGVLHVVGISAIQYVLLGTAIIYSGFSGYMYYSILKEVLKERRRLGERH